MLPSGLLVARVRQGRVEPVFADLNELNLTVAEDLLNAFQASVGERRKELAKSIATLEEVGFDYRFIRGVALLLERRCTFKPKSAVEPVEARRRVFEHVGQRGPATTEDARAAVLSTVAAEMAISREEIEEALWADLEDEQILVEFSPIAPDVLLKSYNLSLLQTLLFKATHLESTSSSGWKNILRYAKYLGLMYTAKGEEGNVVLRFDGPSSLFKLSERYGTSFAKLVPSIVSAEKWRIRAEILSKRQEQRKLYTLDLGSEHLAGKIVAIHEKRGHEEASFDSDLEAEFARSFTSLRTGWKLSRESEPLVVGNHIFIPDFTFTNAGMKVHLEIVGFWTQEYLERKLQKLKTLRDADMLVAVDEHLACSRFKDLPAQLVIFKGKVPLKPILEFLQLKRRRLEEQQAASLRKMEIQPTSSQMTISELANTYGILVETARHLFEEEAVKGYVLVGNTVLSHERLEQIRSRIVGIPGLKLSMALMILEEEGLMEPFQILENLGYTVKWHHLVPDEELIPPS